MSTTSNSVLDQRLHQMIDDYIQEDVTTALAASTTLICTSLNKYDEGSRDDGFNTWYVYVTELLNAGADRKIYDYSAASTQCSVRGGNFTAEASTANFATCRFYKYSYTDCQVAINDAIRETYPVLFRPLEDRTLVTGNILPDNSFELWVASDNPSFYSASNATLTRTTTAGLIRGALGTTSMKVTDSGSGDGYAYISSDQFPRLLDLMGKTVTFKCHAYPEDTADDATIIIYTKQADGTAQTLTSTTSNPKGEFTLLELKDQKLNDDLVEIQFRFSVATASADVYFDSARVTGINLQEYLLLSDFKDGAVDEVYIQTSGYSDDICDDLHPRDWQKVFGSTTYSDGTYMWLRLPAIYSANRQLRLIGNAPLSTVSSFSDTTEISGKQIDLLLAYAAYCLFRNKEGAPSGEDKYKYTSNQGRWLREYERLKPSHRMMRHSGTLILPRP